MKSSRASTPKFDHPARTSISAALRSNTQAQCSKQHPGLRGSLALAVASNPMASMHCSMIPQKPHGDTSCSLKYHSRHQNQPAAFPARRGSRNPTSYAAGPAKRIVMSHMSASASRHSHHLKGQHLRIFGHATGLFDEELLPHRSLHRRGRAALTALAEDVPCHSRSGVFSISQPNSHVKLFATITAHRLARSMPRNRPRKPSMQPRVHLQRVSNGSEG